MFAALRRGPSIEMIKFAIVGVMNTVVGLAIIYSLKWYLHWSDASANLLGYLVCIALGFILNGRWTFGKSLLNLRHIRRYLLVVALAYQMNLSAVLMSIRLLEMSGDYAQLVGVPVFTITSYFMSKIFVFSDTKLPRL